MFIWGVLYSTKSVLTRLLNVIIDTDEVSCGVSHNRSLIQYDER